MDLISKVGKNEINETLLHVWQEVESISFEVALLTVKLSLMTSTIMNDWYDTLLQILYKTVYDINMACDLEFLTHPSNWYWLWQEYTVTYNTASAERNALETQVSTVATEISNIKPNIDDADFNLRSLWNDDELEINEFPTYNDYINSGYSDISQNDWSGVYNWVSTYNSNKPSMCLFYQNDELSKELTEKTLNANYVDITPYKTYSYKTSYELWLFCNDWCFNGTEVENRWTNIRNKTTSFLDEFTLYNDKWDEYAELSLQLTEKGQEVSDIYRKLELAKGHWEDGKEECKRTVWFVYDDLEDGKYYFDRYYYMGEYHNVYANWEANSVGNYYPKELMVASSWIQTDVEKNGKRWNIFPGNDPYDDEGNISDPYVYNGVFLEFFDDLMGEYKQMIADGKFFTRRVEKEHNDKLGYDVDVVYFDPYTGPPMTKYVLEPHVSGIVVDDSFAQTTVRGTPKTERRIIDYVEEYNDSACWWDWAPVYDSTIYNEMTFYDVTPSPNLKEQLERYYTQVEVEFDKYKEDFYTEYWNVPSL